MLGTRQSGLQAFRFARLPEDVALLERARMRARTMLDADPELAQPEHALIADALIGRVRRRTRSSRSRHDTAPMSNHVYKSVEITGTSPDGVKEAIDGAIAKASQSLRNLDWFEVISVRGQIDGGSVAHYQVTLKVGFRLED